MNSKIIDEEDINHISYSKMHEVRKSWDYNEVVLIEQSFYHLVLDNLNSYNDILNKKFGCNVDIIQCSGKRPFRLRIDEIYYTEINNFQYVTSQKLGFSSNSMKDVSITGSYDVNFTNNAVSNSNNVFRSYTARLKNLYTCVDKHSALRDNGNCNDTYRETEIDDIIYNNLLEILLDYNYNQTVSNNYARDSSNIHTNINSGNYQEGQASSSLTTVNKSVCCTTDQAYSCAAARVSSIIGSDNLNPIFNCSLVIVNVQSDGGEEYIDANSNNSNNNNIRIIYFISFGRCRYTDLIGIHNKIEANDMYMNALSGSIIISRTNFNESGLLYIYINGVNEDKFEIYCNETDSCKIEHQSISNNAQAHLNYNNNKRKSKLLVIESGHLAIESNGYDMKPMVLQIRMMI